MRISHENCRYCEERSVPKALTALMGQAHEAISQSTRLLHKDCFTAFAITLFFWLAWFIHIDSVEPALFLSGLLPPPATFAFMLTRPNGPCARLATNADKSAVVKFIVGHFKRAYVIPNLLRRPVSQRIKLS